MTFTTRIMKYQHVHPPGTYFCSTYSEILTFWPSRGDYGRPSARAALPATTGPWLTEDLNTLPGVFRGPSAVSPSASCPKGLDTVGLPEVTFTTRIMKYQHFHPPGTSFCSTYNEILTFLLSGGNFYHTYNEISTFSPYQNVFLLYIYWNINIFILRRLLLLHV